MASFTPSKIFGTSGVARCLRLRTASKPCLCSKTYLITEGTHPRPRQSAMLGNLSVLRIRSA
jgi:hypothetical protein